MHMIILMGGIAGILSFLVWEILTWKELKKFAGVFLILSPALSLTTHTLLLTGPRLYREPVHYFIGTPLMLVSLYLMYRSLWAELPKNSYSPESKEALCQSGTYALVRHPGLWWYGLFLFSFYLVTGSQWLIWMGPIWWLTDLFMVTVEDWFLYPKIFKSYAHYKKIVPFIIPSSASVKNCIRTWGKPFK